MESYETAIDEIINETNDPRRVMLKKILLNRIEAEMRAAHYNGLLEMAEIVKRHTAS